MAAKKTAPDDPRLTAELRKLANEKIVGGKTRIQVLAEHMWNLANGWIERIELPDGTIKEIIHGPDKGMIVQVFDRLEGKAAPTERAPEEQRGVKALDKIRDLAKDRMNQLAKKK